MPKLRMARVDPRQLYCELLRAVPDSVFQVVKSYLDCYLALTPRRRAKRARTKRA
jgi:hypothetical protein